MTKGLSKILYIDDEKENLVGFKYVFKKNFEVLTASSADEGWDLLKSNEVKVLITDQRMPKTTGVQLLEKVADEFPLVYRIILTGYTDVQDIIEAINKGKIFQFIRKPWDKDEVKVIIDNAIRLFDLRKQNKELLGSLKHKNNELEHINQNLEYIISDRTKELEVHRNHLEDLVGQRTAQLLEAKERAEESDRLKSAFLANVSHEIRTPMNAIIGFSELLTLDEYTKEEKEDFKQNVLTNSETLLRLIDDILDISKIEANQVSLNYHAYNLNQILDELYYLYSENGYVRKNNKVQIILRKPDDKNLLVLTDKVRLYQVLSNLLGNSVKFTEKGAIEYGYLMAKNDLGKPVIRFFVRDTGLGIPADAREYIFDRFRKVDSYDSKLYRGAGLGLYICRSLVDKFGGRIWMESNPGKGSVFQFEIPFLPAKEIDNCDTAETQNDDIGIDLKGKKIIIAEDEDSSYLYVKSLLKNSQVDLIRARNGQETIDLVGLGKDVDLVLMDIQMPVMNGYQAVSVIKKTNGKIPVVAQTAYAMTEQKAKILESGFDEFISKPYKASDLINIIRKFI